MADLIATITTAISIAKKLKDISDRIKDVELKGTIADLSLELAELKTRLADVITENVALREKVKALETAEGDPCPKCHKRGWSIESSEPDRLFGDLGGMKRAYRCSLCGFTESKIVTG